MMKNFAFFVGAILMIIAFGTAFAEHELSSSSDLQINGIFGNTLGRNWTGPQSNENMTFTIINNESSADEITTFNLTVNTNFGLVPTIGNSRSWSCANISNVVVCTNNTPANLIAAGENISVWFNVTSPSASSEASYSWSLKTVDNASAQTTTTFTSIVDGAVTGAASPDAPQRYVNSMPTLNWTSSPGSDSVSGIANYTVYNSTSSNENYTVLAVLPGSITTYAVSSLIPNRINYLKIGITDRVGNTRNSSVINTTYDISAPTIGLNTTTNTNFSNTKYPRLYFNATDNFDSNMSCELVIDNTRCGTAYIQNATAGLSIVSNRSFMGTGHTWYVNCTDDAGNRGKSAARTLNIIGADVSVVRVNFTTISNPVSSSSATFYATINNTGNQNLTANVTLKFYVDGTLVNTTTVDNDTLTIGNTYTTSYTKIGGFTGFNHIIRAEALYSENDLNQTNNNNYNYSLKTGYNVTITNMQTPIIPGNNMSITVSVIYPNGSGVTQLDKRNFTIRDIYTGESTHIWGGIDLNKPTGTINVYNQTFVNNNDGTYTFKIGTYNFTYIYEGDTTRPGEHTVNISIAKNESGKYFTGDHGNHKYNLTAPMFDIIYKVRGSSTDLQGSTDQDESDTINYNIYIVNNGRANLTNVNITFSYDTSVFSTVEESSSYKCTTAKKTVNAGAGETFICYISVETAALNDDAEDEIDIVAYGAYNGQKYTYDEDDLSIYVVDTTGTTTTTTTTTSSGATGTTSTTTSYPNCEEDDDCFSEEYCNSHNVCKELSCGDNQIPMNHKCTDLTTTTQTQNTTVTKTGLVITGSPDELDIEHMEERNTTVKISNTGTETLTNIGFALKTREGPEPTGEWYTITQSQPTTLEPGNSAEIKITIKTAGMPIGRYTIGALVTSEQSSDEKAFTILVEPNENERTYINRTMSEMEAEYDRILNQLIYEEHKNPNATEIAQINESCKKLKELIDKAKSALSTGDFLSAYEAQNEAKNLAVEVKTKLDEAEETEEGDSHLLRNSIIFIFVLAAVYVGFNYYENMKLTGKKLPGKHSFNIPGAKKGSEETLRDISFLKNIVKSKKGDTHDSSHVHVERIYGKKETEKKGIKGVVFKILKKGKNKQAGQKTLYDIGYSVRTDKKK